MIAKCHVLHGLQTELVAAAELLLTCVALLARRPCGVLWSTGLCVLIHGLAPHVPGSDAPCAATPWICRRLFLLTRGCHILFWRLHMMPLHL